MYERVQEHCKKKEKETIGNILECIDAVVDKVAKYFQTTQYDQEVGELPPRKNEHADEVEANELFSQVRRKVRTDMQLSRKSSMPADEAKCHVDIRKDGEMRKHISQWITAAGISKAIKFVHTAIAVTSNLI